MGSDLGCPDMDEFSGGANCILTVKHYLAGALGGVNVQTTIKCPLKQLLEKHTRTERPSSN